METFILWYFSQIVNPWLWIQTPPSDCLNTQQKNINHFQPSERVQVQMLCDSDHFFFSTTASCEKLRNIAPVWKILSLYSQTMLRTQLGSCMWHKCRSGKSPRFPLRNIYWEIYCDVQLCVYGGNVYFRGRIVYHYLYYVCLFFSVGFLGKFKNTLTQNCSYNPTASHDFYQQLSIIYECLLKPIYFFYCEWIKVDQQAKPINNSNSSSYFCTVCQFYIKQLHMSSVNFQ